MLEDMLGMIESLIDEIERGCYDCDYAVFQELLSIQILAERATKGLSELLDR